MKIKLKPCPFCGNPNIVIKEDIGYNYETTYTCECEECYARIADPFCTTQESAIKVWNTRVK